MSGGPSSGGGESTDVAWWVTLLKIVAILVLTFLSATFSGLDLGLMSLSPAQLELLIKDGKNGGAIASRNAQRAKQILPVRQDGNLLLCTVLLGNVAVNSCMAVFLDSFAGGAMAFVITTLMVVTFGEIIPQALCYKHGLLIGAKLLPILKVFLLLFYPVNKPMALLLDKVFGQEGHSAALMSPNHMKAALDYQMNKSPDLLRKTESRLLKGALESSDLSVKDVMVPIEDVFCLDAQAIIDDAMLQAVSDAGYSRLPVVEYIQEAASSKHTKIVGHLHVRDLLVVDPARALPVKALLPQFGMDVHTVDSDEKFLTLLHTLKNGNSQLTCVRQVVGTDGENHDSYWFHSGIVTSQDVLNAVAKEDLQEEKDQGLDHDFGSPPGSPRVIGKKRDRPTKKSKAPDPAPERPMCQGCGMWSMLISVVGSTFGAHGGQTEATPLSSLDALRAIGKGTPSDAETSFPSNGTNRGSPRV